MRVERAGGTGASMGAARYWWDRETGILSARLVHSGGRGRVAEDAGAGATCIHVVGDDGSWLSLDVADGRVRGVEVAVWPPIRTIASLAPPAAVDDGVIRFAPSRPGAASCEVGGSVVVHTDAARRHYRFRMGAGRGSTVLRAGRDVLLEATAEGSLAGVWILNVPPSPAARDHDDRPH